MDTKTAEAIVDNKMINSGNLVTNKSFTLGHSTSSVNDLVIESNNYAN